MPSDKRKFEDLLKDAPKAPQADTVSLVGILAQAQEPGKFVLTMAGGQSVTLDAAAVKDHAVLGSSVGQTIVRVDVDCASLPAGPAGGSGTAAGTGTPVAEDTARRGAGQVSTIPWQDLGTGWWEATLLWQDNPYYTARTDPLRDQYAKPPFTDDPFGTLLADVGGGTLQETIPDPTGGGPQEKPSQTAGSRRRKR